MKRHLLLGALLFGSVLGASAQGNTCVSAEEITENGVYAVAGIDGTYGNACFGSSWPNATNGEWYKFEAPENGIITIGSNISATPLNNDLYDTRVVVLEGEDCNSLACVAGNDDVSNVTGSLDYRSFLTLEVLGGTTYYIQWDDIWLNTGFSWEFNFTAATCFTPSGFQYSDSEEATYTTVPLVWTEPSVGDAPMGYEYTYVLDGQAMTTGTVYEVSEAAVTLEGLTSGTDYDFYIRTICGDENYSEWVGPISFTTIFEPATIPYANSFEMANLNGWESATFAGNGWQRYATITSPTTVAPSEGSFQMAVVGSTTAASEVYLVSRPIILPEGNITVNFDLNSLPLTEGAAAAESNLTVLVGQDLADLGSFDLAGDGAEVLSFTETEYTTYTTAFDSPGAGTYYFLFLYTTDSTQTAATQTALFLDNVTIEATAGVKDNEVSKLAVYPNPATNLVNISNSGSALISGVNVTDINGRTVKAVSFDGVANAQVNVSDLATGVYMMTINSDKGSVTKKVVKN